MRHVTPSFGCRDQRMKRAHRARGCQVPHDEGRPAGSSRSASTPTGHLVIDLREHPSFVREEYGVLCEVPISFAQAVPAGTQTGKVFRLKGKGIPRLQQSGRGDQHVRVVVETPTQLSGKQRALLEKFAEISGDETNP